MPVAKKKSAPKKRPAKSVDEPASSKNPNPRRSVRTGQRLRHLPRFKSRKIKQQIRAGRPKIKGSFRRFWGVLKLVRQNPKLYIGITIIYALLTLLFVRGFAGGASLGEQRATLQELFQGVRFSGAITTAALFSSLVNNVSNANLANGAAYQALLLIIISLSVIWATRKVYASGNPRLRDAFYKSMTPFVPFVLVLIIVGIQLIPLLLGNWLYSVVTSGAIAVSITEKVIWFVAFIMLVGTSLYLLSSSIFALFIVTLPDMTPLKALRNARMLVRYRRWTLLRKILFLPLALFVVAAVIMVPFLVWLPVVAEWVFFVLSLFSWVIALTYLYMLYRELINE